MLIGAGGGLYALNPNTGEMARLESTAGNESIRAIANFRGAVYIANFGRGLERLDGEKRSLVWSGSPQVVISTPKAMRVYGSERLRAASTRSMGTTRRANRH
jgi:hypothetical protein